MICLAALAMACLCMTGKTKEIHLKWVHTSDVHGALFGYDYLQRRTTTGGLAAAYSYTRDLLHQYGDRLILTDGGDCLQGQPTSYYYNYVDTQSPHLVAEAMNEMGYVCGVLGNHDVETGHEVYDRWMADCHFPILGANVIDTRTGEPYIKPYIVIEREGIRIAILGMVTPGIPNWLPRQLWSNLQFEEMVSSARKWVNIIQQREHPDLLVGLFHSGFDGGIVTPEYHENATAQVAREVPGFDLICYGHDHQAQVQRICNVAGDTCVTLGPTSLAATVGEADIYLTLNRGKITHKRIEAKTPRISLADTPDAIAFETLFMDQRNTLREWVDQPIGAFTTSVHEREAYFGSSAFIDLVQQLQLDLTGADVSFAAPLSFDAHIDSGVVRVSDMFALYKYENFLYTMRMSGREIKGLLEMSFALWTNQMQSPEDHIMLLDNNLDNGRRKGLKNMAFNMSSAAGILYTVDVTKPEGSKITILSKADGTPFDLDGEYSVAINSYHGNGGGELLTKGAGIPHDELPNRIITSTEKDIRYYLMQKIREQGEITPVALNHWKFVPEEWAKPAIARDRLILFPDEKK